MAPIKKEWVLFVPDDEDRVSYFLSITRRWKMS